LQTRGLTLEWDILRGGLLEFQESSTIFEGRAFGALTVFVETTQNNMLNDRGPGWQGRAQFTRMAPQIVLSIALTEAQIPYRQTTKAARKCLPSLPSPDLAYPAQISTGAIARIGSLSTSSGDSIFDHEEPRSKQRLASRYTRGRFSP